jgi:hypothetical protein
VDATFDGSGNYVGGSVLQYCKVLYAGGSGVNAAIQISSAAPFIDHCEVGDSAYAGIRADNPQNLKITNTTVRNNRWGGIIATGTGQITITGSTIRDQNITHVHGIDGPNGGGISISGNLVATITNNTIANNSNGGYCKDGGGIGISGGTFTITNNTITGNAAVNRGGGINVSSGTGTISNNTLQGNTSASSCTQYGTGGAGINVSGGTVTITGNTINGNRASNCGDGGNGGGGIYVGGGTATITNNTISGNFYDCGNSGSDNGGAGVWIGNMWGGSGPGGPGPTVILTNNTITGNQIQNRGNGAGLYIDCSTFTVTDNTISNNNLNNSSYAGISGIRFTNSYSCVQSGSTFARNVITGNSGTNAQSSVIRIPVSYYAINNNSIHGNNTPYTLWYDGANGTTLNATNNWWGTTDVTQIQNQIWDRNDDLNKGVVNYNPLLMSEGGSSNYIPTATANANPSFGYVPLTVNFTGSGSDNDGTVASYEWDFNGDGVYDWSSTVNGNVGHQYTTSGNYVAVFRVTDNLGLANKILVKVGAVQSGQAIDVGGEIPSNQTWSSGYTFRATDNIIVPTGVTLTIEPNVEVRFNGGKGLQVYGTLVARGTASQPITFTTSSTTPTAGAWQFLNFTDSSVDAAFDGSGNYVSGSVLQYCKVLYAGGSGVNAAIQISSAAPFIDHCEVGDSAYAGIRADNPQNLKITNTTVRNNRWGGIIATGTGQITITGSTIRDQNITHVHGIDGPNGGGISISGNLVATITNNTIANNSNGGYCKDGGGIGISGGTFTITNNTITGNAAVNRGGGINVSSGTGTISNNTLQGNTSASSCTQYGTGGAGINVSGGTVTITGNTINGNRASNCGDGGNGGGGIYVGGGTATITNNTISGNFYDCGNSGSDNGGAGVWIGNMWGGSGPGGPGPTVILTNNTITGNQIQNRGNGAGLYIDCSTFTVTDNTISNNNLNNSSYAGISGIRFTNSYSCVQSGSTFARNVITGNSGTNAQSSVIRIPVSYYAINNSIHGNNTPYTLWYDGANGTTLNATNNWWGTVDASVIYTQIYDFEDNLLKGVVNFSPIRGSDSTSPILGPANPTISVTGYSGTLADPIVNLALSATSPTQMLISDDHTFPSQFQWETFAATKEFHSDGVTG